jgi:hypothetical protein
MDLYGEEYFIFVAIMKKEERIMGRPNWPAYGEVDLGSAIETAENVIAKIKTNKFDKEDLAELVKAVEDLKTAIETYED